MSNIIEICLRLELDPSFSKFIHYVILAKIATIYVAWTYILTNSNRVRHVGGYSYEINFIFDSSREFLINYVPTQLLSH